MVKTIQQRLNNYTLLAIWASVAAFSTYFCMYAFRKPFTAGTFDGMTVWGLDLKIALVIAQVLGYMLSKFVGIKLISEMSPNRRPLSILVLIGFSWGTFTSYTFTTNLDDYYNQTVVKYAGNNATGLNQILTQKYLGFFQQSGWEAFYNQRRTGVPTFKVGPGNTNGQKIPKRWQYPTSELTNNAGNWKAALTNQFGAANDDINADMWLLK